MACKNVDGFGEISEVPKSDGFIGGRGHYVLFVFIEIQAQNLAIVCTMTRDVRFGQGVIPKFE